MKHFNIKAGEKQYIVEADVIICGKDLNVCIGGGEVQHIGASALAIPRKSLANEEKNSASASVICVVGHKDGYFGVAEPPIRSVLSHCLAQNEPPCRWLNHYL